jgi:hypothetical protein
MTPNLGITNEYSMKLDFIRPGKPVESGHIE